MRRAYGFIALIFCISANFFRFKTMNMAIEVDARSTSAECVMDASSRRVLYEEHGDVRLPMASTTKILTAITVLENCKDLNEEFTVSSAAVGVEGSSIYLQENEKFTVKDLLYGLMLRSGNDAAVALALHCANSISAFSTKMNVIAQRAGALNSRFSNPHGLPCDNHYTTARDLNLIASYAMQNEVFKEIVATKYYEPRHWKNKNKMLTTYDAIGIKTGYTKQAGRCLVTAAEKNGMTLVCTVLNCSDMYERTKKLMDDAFAMYTSVKLLDGEERLAITINGKTEYGISHKSFHYPLLKEEEAFVEIKTKALHKVKKSQKVIGQFEIYLSKQLLFSGNLYKL